MGTGGLLPMVKNAIRPSHIATFGGMTAGVDISIWICKGIYSPRSNVMSYVTSRFKFLQESGIKQVAVFDGATPPCKEETVKERAAKRLKLAEPSEEDEESTTPDSEFKIAFTGCVENLQIQLTKMKIPSVVAPYEADSQLAFLASEGYLHLVITEDSDLITLGCNTVFYKMTYEGMGDLYDMRMLSLCFAEEEFQFSFLKFMMCTFIMGNDYIKRVPGMGPAKARKAIEKANSTDIQVILNHIEDILGDRLQLPSNYISLFHANKVAFFHQTVWDPLQREQRPRIPYTPDVQDEEKTYAGTPLEDPTEARRRALGYVSEADAMAIDGTFWLPDYQKPEPQPIDEIIEDGPPRRWACTVEGCQETFARKENMQRHASTHGDEKPWACTVEGCQETFARKATMQRHASTHGGERLWACTVEGCQETFTRKENMQRHASTHGDEKPWACTVEGCQETFARKDHLQQHASTHGGERPWACTVEGCQETFARKATMQRHASTHGGKRFVCTFPGCEKTFSRKDNMISHAKKHV